MEPDGSAMRGRVSGALGPSPWAELVRIAGDAGVSGLKYGCDPRHIAGCQADK